MNEVTLRLLLTVPVGVVVGKCFNFKTDEQEDLSSQQQQIVVDGLLKSSNMATYISWIDSFIFGWKQYFTKTRIYGLLWK